MTTDIVRRDDRGVIALGDAPVAPANDVDSWVHSLGAIADLSQQIANTDFVPRAIKGNVPAVTACILAGREMGIGPMTSLQHIHVIQGKPGQSAALMRSLIQSQGHDLDFGECNDETATVLGRRRGETSWTTVTFTAAQARRAKIDLGGYPEDKLVARASARLARRKFGDVIVGMPYLVEELEDEGTDRDPAPAVPAPTKPASVVDELTGGAAPAAPEQPASDALAEPATITPAQSRKLHAIFGKAGVTDRDARIRVVSSLADRAVESSSALTKDEGRELIDQLEDLGPEGVAALADANAARSADEPAQSELVEDDGQGGEQ